MSSSPHAERAHAKLSASGSHRWLVCPGSVRLEANYPDVQTSYSLEGTKAHELSEWKLRKQLFPVTDEKVEEMDKQFADVPKDMDRHTDSFVDFVIEQFNEARAISKDAELILEGRLDFSDYVPDGFGTGDVVIVSDDVMHVIDLKYGMTEVSAINNSQLRLYALGAYKEYDYMFGVKQIKMTIVQPRIDNYSTEEISVEELIKYGEEYIKPRAEIAASGEGECVAGEHCKFCKAKGDCRTRAEYNLALISEDFSKPDTLTNEELADILANAKQIQDWIGDVLAFTLDRAVNHGEKYPGFKLVAGTSRRKYASEDKVADKLISEGYVDDEIYKPRSLIGLTDLGKLIGSKNVTSMLGDLIIKPPGKPTLVRQEDKRPELNSLASVEADFEGIDL